MPELTWSKIPWNLRAALSELVDVVDLPVQNGRVLRRALRLAGDLMDRDPQLTGLSDQLFQLRLRRHERRHRPDAVLQLGDLGTTAAPFFLYQDLSWAQVAQQRPEPWGLGTLRADPRTVERRRLRQQRVYGEARGVLTMGSWLRDALIADGLAPASVHAVGGGISSELGPLPRVEDPLGCRALFVGRDFFRKAGDDVVRAVGLLRSGGTRVELTVAGPESWPLPGEVPDGVTFVGRVTSKEVGRLMRTHDVFAMPSRFEAYGISFLEARAHGLPCVARDAFAMPELLDQGSAGVLVAREAGAVEVASALAMLLDDEELRVRVRQGAAAVRAESSWHAVARRCMEAIRA